MVHAVDPHGRHIARGPAADGHAAPVGLSARSGLRSVPLVRSDPHRTAHMQALHMQALHMQALHSYAY